MKKHQILFTVLPFFLCYSFNLQIIHAQNGLSYEVISEAVDSLFADKNSMDASGASVIIMQGERLLLSKNYGAANLTFGVPFTENTVFPLEEFTEQLVVFSILQLEKKGQINLNDSVNKYLPEIGFPYRVSLAHLLNHTSGFPMISSLRLMAGWNFSDPFTHDDFLNLSKKFTADVNPDKEFNHNHGGIKFLMMIIEKVSGISFPDYASKNIFDPLGMTNTSIKDDAYRDNNNNSSVGYSQSDDGYKKVVPTQFEVMCPATYSTPSDFEKWMANIQSKKFHGDILERMNESLTVNGKLAARTYGSYCIGQQNFRNYLGQDEIYMRETGNGYSWYMLHILRDELLIWVVGNVDNYIGPKVNGIADLLANYNKPTTSETVEALPPVLSDKEMELLTGFYWNEEFLYSTIISIKDGGLHHADTDNGFNFQMTPRNKTLFNTPFGGTVEFTDTGGDQRKMSNTIPNGRIFNYSQYHPSPVKEGDQLKYVGVYFSDKLNAYFRIAWENNKLILKRSRKPDLELSSLGNHRFRVSEIDFRLIEFKEKINGSFQSMKISNPSVKDIEFRKI